MTKASVLPSGMKLVGDVAGEEDLVVFGEIEGEVAIGGALVVERTGAVRGNVKARTVAIRGVVVGDASAAETIRVDEGGRVVGDVRAPRVNIVKGARFRGHVHMTGRDAKPAPVTESAVQATLGPAAPARAPAPRPRAPERHARSAGPVASEAPTSAGSVRAVHHRRTVPGTEAALLEPRLPPSPRIPALRRTRARRKA